MSDTSCAGSDTTVANIGRTYPCPWSDLKFIAPSPSQLEQFDEDTLRNLLQTEYWWVSQTQVKTSSDKNSEFKSTWLTAASEARQKESRVEMTEYQVVRECLWALVGAEKSFLFMVRTDKEVLMKNLCLLAQKPACLSHLTYGSLDSVCTDVARYATAFLEIRAFADYVLLAPAGKVPLAFTRLAEYCVRMKNEYIGVVSTLEEEAKTPVYSRVTLLKMMEKLSPWFQRLSFVSALVFKVCSAYLQAILSEVASVLLLDEIEQLCGTLLYCLPDKYLSDLLKSVYVSVTEAYLCDMLSETGISGRQLFSPFLKHNAEVSSHHPDFWKSGISLRKDMVPGVIHPIIKDLFVGVKSLSLLQAIASVFRNPNLLECCRFKAPMPVKTSSTNHPEEAHLQERDSTIDELEDPELVEMGEAMRCLALRGIENRSTPLISPRPLLSHEPGNVEDTVRRLREDVRLQCRRVSTHLVSLLLRGSLFPPTELEGDNLDLEHAFKGLAGVALFRAGDRMHAFCEAVFAIRPSERTEAEVNVLLKEQVCQIYGERSWMCKAVRVGFEKSAQEMPACALNLVVDVPWPLNVVLTKENVAVYEGIFRFLITMNHAKWALDRSRWRCQTGNDHGLSLLRSRFLFVINGLQAFIFDHIEEAHVQFLKDKKKLTTADCCLDDLLECLSKFLARVSELCLLQEDCPSQKILNRTLRDLFGLCLQFQTPSGSRIDVSRLAEDFSTRIAFLRNVFLDSTQEGGRSDLPLLQILESAHLFNTQMATRLH